jgi:hypothetical protein
MAGAGNMCDISFVVLNKNSWCSFSFSDMGGKIRFKNLFPRPPYLIVDRVRM